MKSSLRRTAAALVATALLAACGGDPPARSPVTAPPDAALVPTPTFDADTAYALVAAQVAFGPRVPNTVAHVRCGDFLLDQLRSYGWQTQEQPFDAKIYDGTVLRARNLIAAYQPEARKRLLLCAHWDTRPFADQDADSADAPIDGANDGGSGVAVLLEVARQLGQAETPPDVGVDIILFDAEDHGPPASRPAAEDDYLYWCLGSQHWARNKHRAGYAAYYGILLDMVGGQNAQFFLEETSMQYAPSVMRNVWSLGQRLGYEAYFRNEPASGLLDDHYFINTLAKIPTIDIIHYDPVDDHYFIRTWHTHDDTLENIDRASLKAVGQTLLQTIYQE